MTWTSLSFSFGSLLTSAKMTQLHDNITALANGDSGAPSIQEAAMGASSINQAALKTTTGTISTGAIWSGSSVDLVIPGGLFYLGLEFVTGIQSQFALNWPTLSANASYVTMGINAAKTGGSGGYSGTLRSTYIQASPPYDLGDGVVSDFIMAVINADGTLGQCYCAPDAPWHYNGPTIIRADRYDSNGKSYKRVPLDVAEELDGKIISTPMRIKQIEKTFNIESVLHTKYEEIEITQKYKNKDMQLIPHPFSGDLTGKTIIMIDPVSKLAEQLQSLRQQGGDVIELLNDGRVMLENTPLQRNGPPGVMIVSARWKNSATRSPKNV